MFYFITPESPGTPKNKQMKKKMLFLAMSILMFGCSTDDGGEPAPQPTPTQEKLVANDDQVTGKEDEDLVISGILDNDELVNGARLSEFSAKSANDIEIRDNRDGTFTYIPADDFIGEDSFTYTICDTASPKNCETATVTITIEDAGNPEANDDEVSTVASVSIELTSLLENDTVVDEAVIDAVDDSNSAGTVEINDAGNVVYTPAAGFTGDDTFTYSLCDDDETPNCATATVTVTVYAPVAFNIPADLQEYYQNIAFSDVKDLNYELLAELTESKHTTRLSYTDRHDYLYEADADLEHQDSVVLMYSGERRYWQEYTSGSNTYSPQTFNTEHIYPQSLLASDEAKNDLHLLRVADANVNSERLNYPYGDGSGEYGIVGNEVFFPGDEWKGDVARIIMYVNLRYGEGFSTVGVGGIDLFLEWNREDPVSAFELQRQEVIEAAQGDRNPFIDNPYLATLIWGGEPAENRWK